ncbi:RDD family protein [Nocardia otitidiscaviarum]|uniref:RDD family protein n=1 Tax=Nocardia otitidiscaviarum TaxID=1823 RepID=UPI001893737D|nr:RDD family protein [Nocardia otitidiscaviarum]MBF6237971.1 RDD family protein [Nocardia otitidiscaviarum]
MALFTTGEAVAVELPVARLPARAVAFLIDLVVQLVGGLLLIFVAEMVLAGLNADSAWEDAALIVIVVGVLIGYPVACETLTRGRTVGKLALGLRVVRADGGPVDFRHALTRGLGGIVDFWILGTGLIAILVSLCSPQARRVGDILAGTVVVHGQTRIPYVGLAVPPPWLLAWSRQLDVSGLSDDTARAVRQYLLRFPGLTPPVQQQLGAALLHAVCAELAMPVPAGHPPMHILGAILAERQRRALPAPPAAPAVPLQPETQWSRPVATHV